MPHEHDILDRTDRSLAPSPPGKHSEKPTHAMPKRDKFQWATTDEHGEFHVIDKHDLAIDGRYQRKPVNEEKVRKIARNWSWLLFGAISVVRLLQDNFAILWVFDGGHRVRGSFFRDDVHGLPCMVYKVDQLSDAARAFIDKNILQTYVSAVDRFKASVCAEDHVAMKCIAILKEKSVEVARTATSNRHLKCIVALENAVKTDERLARNVFDVCYTIAGSKPVDGACLRGLFTLARKVGPDIILCKYRDRLLRLSQEELRREIRSFKAECLCGGEVVEARAILRAINNGLRKKIPWES